VGPLEVALKIEVESYAQRAIQVLLGPIEPTRCLTDVLWPTNHLCQPVHLNVLFGCYQSQRLLAFW